ncbi:hypothetical protein LZ30DRAFT_42048 [Colletotrichum cereale]|nr:hypothetical protein LZ30DRAFT_42048 [Colletotrichum cereale]
MASCAWPPISWGRGSDPDQVARDRNRTIHVPWNAVHGLCLQDRGHLQSTYLSRHLARLVTARPTAQSSRAITAGDCFGVSKASDPFAQCCFMCTVPPWAWKGAQVSDSAAYGDPPRLDAGSPAGRFFGSQYLSDPGSPPRRVGKGAQTRGRRARQQAARVVSHEAR